jgi:hypothetical protein
MSRPPSKSGSSPLSIVTDAISSTSPPGHLDAPGRRLWDAIQREYEIRDAAGLQLLFEACAEIDNIAALSEAVRRDGRTVYTRTGMPKDHPSLKSQLAARAFVVRTLERLGVTTEAVQPPGLRRDAGRGSGWIPDHLK